MSVLSKIVPSVGYVAIFGFDRNTKRGFKPEYLLAPHEIDDEYINNAVARLTSRGATDFYYSVASFMWPEGTPRSRAATFAANFRSYIVDIDCHGNPGEYASPREAITDGLSKLDPIGLGPSSVVYTGRGVQFIWAFDRNIGPAKWQEFAAEMWSVLMHLGIKADPSCQGDRARIFRLPGTVNSKNGQTAKFLLDGDALSFRKISAEVSEYILTHSVQMVDAARYDDDRDADEHGSVFDCPENEKLLAWLMERIPAEFSKVDWSKTNTRARDGYSVWRNIIWAIKRTGLDNAWEVAEDWAMQADGVYDDIPESLRRTWDSDDDNKSVTIGPGTLVAMAKEFAPARKRKGLKGFHFYTEAEVNDLRAAGGYVDPDERPEVLPEPHDYCTEVHDDPEPANDDEFWNCAEPEDYPIEGADPSDIECEFQPGNSALDFIEDLEEWAQNGGIAFCANDNLLTPDDDEVDDGREDGYDGPLQDTPPGEFGSPDFPLPHGYVLRRDAAGRVRDLCVKMKRETADGDAGEELVPMCSKAIELIAADVMQRDTGPEFTYVFRWYDNVSGQPERPFQVPASMLAAPSELAKILSGAGGFLSSHPKAPSLMSIYLRALAEKRRLTVRDRRVYEQCGWTDGTREFVLGKVKMDSNGKLTTAQLSKGAMDSAGAFGQTKGTEKAQAEVIDFYGHRPASGRAVLSMNLGAPLAALLPVAASAVYVYTEKSGTGKTSVNEIGMGFYGDPVGARLKAESTFNGIEEVIIHRKDIQTFIDDFKIENMEGASKGGRGKTAEGMRNFILQITSQTSRRRMSTSGAYAGTNNMRWAAPTFMTSNAPPESFMGVRSHSSEAIYARLMTVPYDEMEGAFTPGMEAPEGGSAERKWKENYGFIGPRFLRHVMLNQKEVRDWLDKKYAELSAASQANGTATLHRFYNVTIACGLYALKWLKASGLVPSWDEQETAECLTRMAYNNDEDAKALNINSIEKMMEDFSADTANATVVCGKGGMILSHPDLNRMPKVVVRIEGDNAFVSAEGFKKYCIAHGVDSKRALSRIREEYGFCVRQPSQFNFTAGLSTNRQAGTALRMPARIFVDNGTHVATHAEPDSGNVVRLPKGR